MAASAIIDSFFGPHFFLSNFFPCEIEYQGVKYPSTEHAYQAHKNPYDKEWIAQCSTGGHKCGVIKRMSRNIRLRPDWDQVKVDVMRDVLRLKFAQEPFKRQLRETADAKLVEGNTWGDKFWGVCNGVGQNWLGRLLMELRAEDLTAKSDAHLIDG